jgi:hypothetical protein
MLMDFTRVAKWRTSLLRSTESDSILLRPKQMNFWLFVEKVPIMLIWTL